MTQKNIVLIGFMGSGKSAVSRQLSDMTGRAVYSTDEIIEAKEGLTISQIFEKHGEKYFRGLERDAVKNIMDETEVIIDCGGGVAINSDNINDLKKNGVLFYLYASPDFLFDMVKSNEDRPLMQVEDPLKKIREMLKEREEFYEQADYKIISEYRTIEEISQEIKEVMDNE